MNKKIIFSCVAMLCSLHELSVFAQFDNENPNETFPLNELPNDVQKLIISYMWTVDDSSKEFKGTALEWNRITSANPKEETSESEREKYGFDGKKTPINFYTLKDNKPSVSIVGYIIERAQPSILDGRWYIKTDNPTTHIFLNAPSKTYTTLITNIHKIETIFACSLSVHGRLAIAWNDTDGSNITFSNLAEVKKGKPIDLDKDKTPLDFLDTHNAFFHLNTLLFNRQGTFLACIYNVIPKTVGYSLQHIKVPDNDTPLTAAQICKRIMHIPTADTKALGQQ